MVALVWIAHAERVSSVTVELGSTDFDTSNVPSISTLVGYCQGLIAVNREVLAMRLVQFALQEYLSTHRDIFGRPHSNMAEICLTYLNSQQVKAFSADPSLDTQETPFLEYCSVYW